MVINMVLYLITILVSMLIISILDYIFIAERFGLSFGDLFLAVTISTIVQIIIDLIIAFCVRRLLPEKWFTVKNKCFCANNKERKFYEKIGIKFWKDKIIDLGMLSGFRKNKIDKPRKVEYIERYILEANFGVAVHLACIVLGFIVIFIFPLTIAMWVGFPVSMVNVVLNLLPLFALRYNLPKLHVLYKFNKTREIHIKNL